MAAINEMAARSLRCVAIAYRSYEMDKVPSDEESLDQWVLPEDDLVLLAIVGIKVYVLKQFSHYTTNLYACSSIYSLLLFKCSTFLLETWGPLSVHLGSGS